MVDQTSVNPSTNGNAAEAPPQAVARTSMEFLHDLLTLCELQTKLIGVDLQSGLDRLLLWAGILIAGLCVALACVPLCLAAVALGVAEYGHFSLAQAFGISVFSGLLLAAGLVGLAVIRLRSTVNVFDRSWAEWRQNVRWAKDTLRRLSSSGPNNRFPPSKVR
jgi:hypothetical protein